MRVVLLVSVCLFLISAVLFPNPMALAQEKESDQTQGVRKRISELIQNIGGDEYKTREKAKEEIAILLSDPKTVDIVLSEVRKYLDTQDPNIKMWLEGEVSVYIKFGITGDLLEKYPYVISDLTAEDAEVRGRIAYKLASSRDVGAIGPLIGLLADKDDRVQNAAANSLGTFESQAVEPLLAALGRGDPLTRGGVALALGLTDDDRVIEPLINALKDTEPEVREKAAMGLGVTKSKRAVEPLIALLKDKEANVRKGAAWALAQIRDDRAIEPLIEMFADPDASVRGWGAGFIYLFGTSVVKRIIRELDDERPEVRAAAADALGCIGDARATESLIPLLQDKDNKVRRMVAFSLGRIRDKRATEPLIKAMGDANLHVCDEAIESLGKIGDKKAIEPLIKMLMRLQTDYILIGISEALLRINDPQGVDILVKELSVPENQEFARVSLKMIGRSKLHWLTEAYEKEQDEKIKRVLNEIIDSLKEKGS